MGEAGRSSSCVCYYNPTVGERIAFPVIFPQGEGVRRDDEEMRCTGVGECVILRHESDGKVRQRIMDKAWRVLVIMGGGTVIPQIARDAGDALVREGATVGFMEIRGSLEAGHFEEETRGGLRSAVRDFNPDFFLSVDGGGFREDPEFFAELRVPVAAWFVDNPFYAIDCRHAVPNLMFFSWDRWYLEAVKGLGITRSAYLPLGTNPERFRRMPEDDPDRKRFACDVSFVGDSVTDNAWRAARESIGSGEVLRFLEEAIEEQYAHPELSMEEIVGRREAAFGTTLRGVDRRRLFEMMEEEATGRFRRAAVQAAKRFRPHVYGDDGWKEVIGDWGVFRGWVDYHGELPKVYGASRISLNATKLQLRTTVNQRVFDVAACGGFVLTDYRPDMETLFDMDKEVAVYRDFTELEELTGYYLENEEARGRVSKAARRRVLGEHTYRHRMRSMLGQIEAWM